MNSCCFFCMIRLFCRWRCSSALDTTASIWIQACSGRSATPTILLAGIPPGKNSLYTSSIALISEIFFKKCLPSPHRPSHGRCFLIALMLVKHCFVCSFTPPVTTAPVCGSKRQLRREMVVMGKGYRLR